MEHDEVRPASDSCDCLARGLARGFICGKPQCWQVKLINASMARLWQEIPMLEGPTKKEMERIREAFPLKPENVRPLYLLKRWECVGCHFLWSGISTIDPAKITCPACALEGEWKEHGR